MLNMLGRPRGRPFFAPETPFFSLNLARYTWERDKITKKLAFCELTIFSMNAIMSMSINKPL